MSKEAPQYTALKKSFLDGRIVQEGETVTFTGIPGKGLLPLNDAAEAAMEEYKAANLRQKQEFAAARAEAVQYTAMTGEPAPVVSALTGKDAKEARLERQALATGGKKGVAEAKAAAAKAAKAAAPSPTIAPTGAPRTAPATPANAVDPKKLTPEQKAELSDEDRERLAATTDSEEPEEEL